MSRQPYIVSKYAKRTVFANRGRSILTLMGIIVATVMFSIVVSAHTSATDILKSFVDDDFGTWHVCAHTISSLDYSKMARDERVESVAYVQEIGYNTGISDEGLSPSEMSDIIAIDGYKYFIGAMSPNFPDLCNLELVRGRLPENEKEAIISLEMYSDDRETWQIGNTIDLAIYSRYSEGKKVSNLSGLTKNRFYAFDEQLYEVGHKEYTIVGYFIVPEYVHWKNLAQDTILTFTSQITYGNAMNAYFKLSDPAAYQEYAEEHIPNMEECLYNKDYIRMENSADDRRAEFIFTLLSFCAIFVIWLLADMLIYNSFSTSSSERIRAIGLMKSVGATRKQVRELMFFESVYYCIIGIPIGVLLGQISSAVLFRALNGMARNAANYFIAKNIDLSYRLCAKNLIIPAVYSIICVAMAITTPMIRMSKIAPIEALRANEIFTHGLRRKKSKGIAVKLLGFTGALSLKNYIRHRKRYRATVVSIVTSIMMITCAHMLVNAVVQNMQVDDAQRDVITYIRPCGQDGFSQADRNTFYQLASLNTVYSSRMVLDVTGELVLSDISMVDKEFLTTYEDLVQSYVIDDDENMIVDARIVFVEDSAFRQLCEENNLDADPYLTYGSEQCLTNNLCIFSGEDGQSISTKLFRSFPNQQAALIRDNTVKTSYSSRMKLKITGKVDGSMFSCADTGAVQIYVPMSRLDYYKITHVRGYEYFSFRVVDPQTTVQLMRKMMEQNLYRSDYLVDAGREVRARDSVNNLASTVLYGYVILLSFMCFLNVVMTVISNIVFRRREYILLTSIGMSRKTLFRMVVSESIVYFCESLIVLGLIMLGFLLGWMFILDPHIFSKLQFGFVLIIIGLHLLVVMITTAAGLSYVMKDEIIENVRKEYY